ncbi:hypothetical protein LTR17_018079 [Elasticomyces elasticus]|nr:hypothetical protein LTR17_018079 [Elasticomyces elasticus]
MLVVQFSSVQLTTSFTNGLLTVAIPAMATNLALEPNLLVWPSSVYFLTSGASLLTAGAVSDVSGPRAINLVGCLLLACFMLASGLARTGIELIMFRAMQGIASAMIMPSSMSIVSTSVENGRSRNIGFACVGMSQPLGFSLGLVLGGLFVKTVGWRYGFYIAGALGFVLFLVGIWVLPKVIVDQSQTPKLKRLASEIDWVGAALASGSIATFSYVLAQVLVSMCGLADMLISTHFQEVQGTTALSASLRMLPNLLIGAGVNVVTGVLVDKLPAIYAVLGASSLNISAPLLMALINPCWPYWYAAFFAQIFSGISCDVLFTVGLLIVSASFPAHTQGLAGAVFNTVTQLGASIGLTVLSIISTTVTDDSAIVDKSSPGALFEGYKAGFWTLVGMMGAAVVVGGIGLRKLGKVGEKRD